MKDELCKAFCGSLTVRDVPVGLAVGTGFRQPNGDAVGFYIVYETPQKIRARIEDDGQTVAALVASGVDVTAGPRAQIFSELLEDAAASYNEKDAIIHTNYMDLSKLPQASLAFVALLVRVQDLAIFSRERVEETFKDDVLEATRERFNGRAEILVDVAPTVDFAHFPADIVIKPSTGTPLAIFVGTSEPKALEAYILWMKVEMLGGNRSKVMLVLDTAKPPRIKERTLARVLTSFNLAVFPGQEIETMDAMERAVFGAVSPRGTVGSKSSIH